MKTSIIAVLISPALGVIVGVSVALGQSAAPAVYPGCASPPTKFNEVWYVDPVNGKTEAAWAAAGVPIWNPMGTWNSKTNSSVISDAPVGGYQGDAKHPWSSLQGIFGPSDGLSGSGLGYPYPLLASTPYYHSVPFNPLPSNSATWGYEMTPDPIEFGGHGGPIHPGDEILLVSGTYPGFNTGFDANNMPGAVITGGPNYNPATGLGNLSETIAGPGWVTIAPAPGATPIISGATVIGGQGIQFAAGIAFTSATNTAASNGESTILSIRNASNVVIEGDQIYTVPLATFDGWTGANMIAYTQSGVAASGAARCVSVTQSHVFDVWYALATDAPDTLFQGNETDHFLDDGHDVGASNVTINEEFIHDWVNSGVGAHPDGIQTYGGGNWANLVYTNNWLQDSNDPKNPFPGTMQGIDSYGDASPLPNLTVANNVLILCSGNAIVFDNVQGGVISNNTLLEDCAAGAPFAAPAIIVDSGVTSGYLSTNLRITNNIVGGYGQGATTAAAKVQWNYNLIIAPPNTGARLAYYPKYGTTPFWSATPGWYGPTVTGAASESSAATNLVAAISSNTTIFQGWNPPYGPYNLAIQPGSIAANFDLMTSKAGEGRLGAQWPFIEAANELTSMRSPSESYIDVLLTLVRN